MHESVEQVGSPLDPQKVRRLWEVYQGALATFEAQEDLGTAHMLQYAEEDLQKIAVSLTEAYLVLTAELEVARSRQETLEARIENLARDMVTAGAQIQEDAENLCAVAEDDEGAISQIIQNAEFLQAQARLGHLGEK